MKLIGQPSCPLVADMFYNVLLYHKIYEHAHDKTNEMTCAPSEDSDQPGHLPSLIKAFAVSMKKHWAHSYSVSTQRRLIRLGGCPG